jgi:hypothetical protein
MAHNVTIGVGVLEIWDARNTRFDIAWVSDYSIQRDYANSSSQASLAAGGNMSKTQVLGLGSSNVIKLLTGAGHQFEGDMVATSGGDLLDFGSKVAAVLSPGRGLVNIL